MGVSQPRSEKFNSEFLLTLNKKLTSECFATLSAIYMGAGYLPAPFDKQEVSVSMSKDQSIGIYDVDWDYVKYLSQAYPHLYRIKKEDQANSRKYVGIVLEINDMNYFAPLSSYKEKHSRLKDNLDLIKIKKYAVINLNYMFPVPDNCCHMVDFSKEKNPHYRDLLRAEYRYIKMIREKIWKNAKTLYNHKLKNKESTPLAKRCYDFKELESICRAYK